MALAAEVRPKATMRNLLIEAKAAKGDRNKVFPNKNVKDALKNLHAPDRKHRSSVSPAILAEKSIKLKGEDPWAKCVIGSRLSGPGSVTA